MKKIKICRCDDRLIHGQVNYKWLEYYKVKKIIIIDKKIANDVIEKGIIRLATPKNIELIIMNEEEALKIDKLFDEKSLVLVKGLKTIEFLIENFIEIEIVNIGRIPTGIGRSIFRNNIYLSKEEREILEKIKKTGTKITCNSTPEEEEEII